MAKNNIKRRYNSILNLSAMKRYSPLSGKFYVNGGEVLQQMNKDSREAFSDFTDSGSGMASGIGSLLGAATTMVNAFHKNASIADTSGIESSIYDTQSTDFSSATDVSSLLDSWNEINWQNSDYTKRDVRGISGGEAAMNSISAMGSGAAAGAQVGGPWGAVAGAGVGLASGLASIFTGNRKAKEKAAELNMLAERANTRAINNFNSKALNVNKNTAMDLTSNIAADGGRIYIKPSKRGTFTAAAKKRGMGVQEFARKVLANKDNYSPAMVKKANFARNFGGRKHDLGGYLFTHGEDWTNGLSTIDTGGTHSENPYGGVPMGVAPDNQPNLVEQGEVVFNDYVFSNRLHPTEKELEKANLPKRYKGHTFALIAEDMGKESSERSNDPISKRGLEDSMMKLAMIQEAQRARKGKKGTQQMMAFGGRKFAGGGPGGMNPALTGPEAYNNMVTSAQQTGMNPDLIVPPIYTMSDAELNDIIAAADKELTQSIANIPDVEFDFKDNDIQKVKPIRNKSSLPIWMRYTPALGSALGALHSVFQKPDYENADILMQEARNLSRPSVRYRALNNYLTYRPLDRNYYLNQLKGQAGATRRGIMNSGANAGNVMAGLLAADYNAQNAVGNTLMQMEQYNDAQRQRIAEFNRGTDQYNSQAAMSADAQNAQLAQNRDRLRSSLMTQAVQMREAADTALEATRSANLTNFFDNLGGIGRENFIFNQINTNPAWASAYKDLSGTVGHKTSKGGMLTKKNRRRR